MTQVCSLLSSAADVNNTYENKRLPKGIHIVGVDDRSILKVEGTPENEGNLEIKTARKSSLLCEDANKGKEELPWGYIFIQHMSANAFDKNLENRCIEGNFKPKCFVHRTLKYKKKPNGKGIMKELIPTVSGLVFLQGTTKQLKTFLLHNFPQYYLVNNCSTGEPASIPNRIMKPFMAVMENDPKRVTFLRDPFIKFAKEHVKLRVLTGLFKGQEGYVVRVNRDRQLVMDLGGYAVAISNVHNEDFEIAE